MGTSDGSVIGITTVVDHGDPSYRWNLVILSEGYTQNQLTQFHSDVQNFIAAMRQTTPYDELWCCINIYRIDVSSTDAGANDPVACGGTGSSPRTYFDASFCGDGRIQRLLVVNNSTVNAVVNNLMPQAHMILVIVNSTIYGGSGGGVATFSLAPGANEIALHEMGHTAFGLADEYEYYAGCGIDPPASHDHYTGNEPSYPNVTANSNRTTNKWVHLIAASTPIPTTSNADCTQCDSQPNPHPANTVGAYEGSYYYHCGTYRPQFNCRMRALNNPYCTVCQEVIRQTIGFYMGPERLPASNLRIVDSFGNVITGSVTVGMQIVITVDLTNRQCRDQPFAYVMQIQDANGVVVSLSWIIGIMPEHQTQNPGMSWNPQSSGSYTVQIFVWGSINNPDALSPPLSTTINVI